jgi:hypothetical protein
MRTGEKEQVLRATHCDHFRSFSYSSIFVLFIKKEKEKKEPLQMVMTDYLLDFVILIQNLYYTKSCKKKNET